MPLVDLLLAKRSGEPIWWAPFSEVVEDWFADLVGGEGEAEREITYERGLVPGLLQTEAYIDALTSASAMVPDKQRELVVGLRLERQHRLQEEAPLELVALIEESVLSRPVGSPKLMREQLDHLVALGEQDDITVQIVPTSAETMSSADSDQVRWRRSSRSNHQGACVEVVFVTGGVAARDSKEPQGAVLVFDRARWAAFLRRLAA